MNKHVLILHHVSTQGGGTKSMIDIAVMLNDVYKVTICVPMGSKDTQKLASEYAINCYEMKTPIPMLNVFSGCSGLLSKSFIEGIKRCLRIEEFVDELLLLEPDVVILNSLVTAFVARKIPKRITTICFVRETFAPSIFDGYIKNTFNNYIDGVAYIAEHEKKYLSITKPEQIVIPDTLEPKSIKIYTRDKVRKKYDIENNKFCVLYMGGSSRLKGFDVMLDAVRYLDNNCCVLFVGNINKKMFTIRNIVKHFYNPTFVCFLLKSRRLMKKYRNDKRVRFFGYQKDIARFMCVSDVIAFPSYKPHQPRPCIEAGMFHKPVVISDFEATEEYFINNYNALTFPHGNSKELASCLTRIKDNPNFAKQIGDNNYEMSNIKHDFERIKNLTNCFLKKIIDR